MKSINIDLYDASTADHFFIRQVVNGLNPSVKTYSWTIPETVPTSNTYTVRVWGQYTNQKPNDPDYWSLPDTQKFLITRFPIGIGASSINLKRGLTLNSYFYVVRMKQVNATVPMTLVLQNFESKNAALKQGIMLRNNLLPTEGANTYSWFVHPSFLNSKRYRLRLSGLSSTPGTPVFDESSAVVVEGDIFTPAISVSIDAASIQAGSQVQVRIAQKDQTNQDIQLQFTAYKAYLVSNSPVSPFFIEPKEVTLIPNTGLNYLLVVPTDFHNGDYYLFLVVSGVNGVPTTSASSKVFSVTGAANVQTSPDVKPVSPAGGASIAANSVLTIKWEQLSGVRYFN